MWEVLCLSLSLSPSPRKRSRRLSMWEAASLSPPLVSRQHFYWHTHFLQNAAMKTAFKAPGHDQQRQTGKDILEQSEGTVRPEPRPVTMTTAFCPQPVERSHPPTTPKRGPSAFPGAIMWSNLTNPDNSITRDVTGKQANFLFVNFGIFNIHNSQEPDCILRWWWGWIWGSKAASACFLSQQDDLQTQADDLAAETENW